VCYVCLESCFLFVRVLNLLPSFHNGVNVFSYSSSIPQEYSVMP
jgi:hypothetical protein